VEKLQYTKLKGYMKMFKFFKKQQGNFLNDVNLDIVAIKVIKYLHDMDISPINGAITNATTVNVQLSEAFLIESTSLNLDVTEIRVRYTIIGNYRLKRYSFTMPLDEFEEHYENI
jgi:hypothetical protein